MAPAPQVTFPSRLLLCFSQPVSHNTGNFRPAQATPIAGSLRMAVRRQRSVSTVLLAAPKPGVASGPVLPASPHAVAVRARGGALGSGWTCTFEKKQNSGRLSFYGGR